MDEPVIQPTTEEPQVTTGEILPDPNEHLHKFLQENNYQLDVTALSDKNPFIAGGGFVLTDKPLLVVTVTRKETT